MEILLVTDVKRFVVYTVKPRYNEDLGTMKITLLQQVSCYNRVKTKKYKELGTSKITLLQEGFVISDLFITRFHCINQSVLELSILNQRNWQLWKFFSPIFLWSGGHSTHQPSAGNPLWWCLAVPEWRGDRRRWLHGRCS